MKKILKFIVLLIVVGLLGFGLLLWRLDSIASYFKQDLEKLASTALGSAVAIGKIKVSVFPHTVLEIEELTVGSASNSSRGLKLKNALLDIALFPLLSGKLEIVKVALLQPTITFLKDANGVSIEGLPKAAKATVESTEAKKPTNETAAQVPAIPSGIQINLEAFELQDAHVILRDTEQNTSYDIQRLTVHSGLQLSSSEVRLPQSSVTGSLFGELDFSVAAQNIVYELAQQEAKLGKLLVKILGGSAEISGAMKLKQGVGQLKLSSAGLRLDDLSRLGKVLPAMAGLEVSGGIAPNVNLQWQMGSAISFEADGAVAVTDSKLHKGAFGLGLTSANFSFPKIVGTTGAQMMSSLRGSLDLKVENGTLEGINIATEVLKAVKSLPFLSGDLNSTVPQSERGALNDPNTALKQVSGHFDLASGLASTQDFKAQSILFDPDARGNIALAGNIDLATELAFNPELSAALVSKVGELKALQNAEGRMVWPLSLKGTPPHITVLPDLNRVMELVGKTALKEKAGKLLENVLGGGAKNEGKKKGLGSLLGF